MLRLERLCSTRLGTWSISRCWRISQPCWASRAASSATPSASPVPLRLGRLLFSASVWGIFIFRLFTSLELSFAVRIPVPLWDELGDRTAAWWEWCAVGFPDAQECDCELCVGRHSLEQGVSDLEVFGPIWDLLVEELDTSLLEGVGEEDEA